jgi:hypothetical protein
VAQGDLSFLKVCWRELLDWPKHCLQAHWYALTKKELSMTTIYKKPEWFFYPAWIILTALCFPTAFFISFIILKIIIAVNGDYIYVDGIRHITEDYLFIYVFVPLVGLLIGTLQYGLLRRYLPRMGWWVAATILGMLLIPVVGYTSTLLPGRLLNGNSNWSVFVMIALMAGLLSFMQWLVLRRRVPRAIWWIPATIAGWVAVRLVSGEGTVGPLDIAHLTILPAIVTGITLGLLINQVDHCEPKSV